MAMFYMMEYAKKNVLPKLSDLVKKNVPSVLLDATPVLKWTLVINAQTNTSKNSWTVLELV
jgi:hypothetical protein